jgi:hypothetical protein
MVVLPAVGDPQPDCDARPLSDQQIVDTIQKARAARADLPKPFPKYRWLVRRQGCHYTYIEYGLPEAPEYNQIFKLNQHGAIVDAYASSQTVGSMKCPDRVLTETELAGIVAKERAKRGDLPAPFPGYKVRVQRLRCLYLYFEYALPETTGTYQVFTIDPFGELMGFSRSPT